MRRGSRAGSRCSPRSRSASSRWARWCAPTAPGSPVPTGRAASASGCRSWTCASASSGRTGWSPGPISLLFALASGWVLADARLRTQRVAADRGRRRGCSSMQVVLGGLTVAARPRALDGHGASGCRHLVRRSAALDRASRCAMPRRRDAAPPCRPARAARCGSRRSSSACRSRSAGSCRRTTRDSTCPDWPTCRDGRLVSDLPAAASASTCCTAPTPISWSSRSARRAWWNRRHAGVARPLRIAPRSCCCRWCSASRTSSSGCASR